MRIKPPLQSLRFISISLAQETQSHKAFMNLYHEIHCYPNNLEPINSHTVVNKHKDYSIRRQKRKSIIFQPKYLVIKSAAKLWELE